MFNNVALGQYYDTGSVLHRADPRVKIILFIVYLAAIFSIKTPQALIAATLIIVLKAIVARIPVRAMRSTVRPVIPVAVLIFFVNLFSVKDGTVIWEWAFFRMTDQSLSKAVLMTSRLVLLIIDTSILLTLTTTPLKIADALESLFSPLKIFRVPVHEMAMMMSIALRFIPTLSEETDKIMKAQTSRGADYDTGSILTRVRGYVTVLIPLFVSSFKRADELAVAMDARCYRGGDGRTKLNPLRLMPRDIIIGIVLLAGALAIMIL